MITSGADRQEIFEFEPEEVIPAVTLDEVILVGVVAAGAFIGKIRIADDVGLIVLEVAHRDDRVQKKAFNSRHLKIATHQKTHCRPFGTGHGSRQQCGVLLGTADHAVDISHRKAEALVVKCIRQA